MNNIGVNINSSKDKGKNIMNYVCNVIRKTFPQANLLIYEDGKGLNTEKTKELDILVVLGGDGTILRAVRNSYKYEVPILGINIGHLGFLSGGELSHFEMIINKIKNNEFKIKDRLMISCKVNSKDKILKEYVALNDIVIGKGTLSRVMTYDIFVDNSFYITYKADGVIVSTPTGSTAYALSAGGPLIYPTLEVISLTPICPISFSGKTMILDKYNKIKIKLNKQKENVYLTCDGQMVLELNMDDEIEIGATQEKCKIIELDDYDYFKLLRTKIISRSRDCEGDN